MRLLAYTVSSVDLDSHALLLNLHYKRGYKRLLTCLPAATGPYVNLGSHSHMTLHHSRGNKGLSMCLNGGKVPYVKFKVHSHLTAFLSLQRLLGTVNVTVLAYTTSFVGLDSHALLLNLHYKRGY